MKGGEKMKLMAIALLFVSCLCIFTTALTGETPKEVDDSLKAAQSQFEAGTYSAAIATLLTAVSRNPDRADLHYWLERAYYELHDYDSAITHGKRSTQLDQGSSLYHQWLGRAYGGKAARESSLFVALKVQKEFEEAVRLNPSNISARRDLQRFYTMAPWIINGREKALDMVDAIAELDAVEGHLARAQLYLKNLRKPDLAENEYILALDGRPNRPEPYFEIAAFYEDRKNGSAIQMIIEYAEQADPADPRLAYYRGVAGVLINDDLETAQESLKSYLARSPERSDWPSHAAAYEWLGRLYEQEEELVEAIEQYRAALKIDPERKEATERLERLEKLVRQR